MKAKLFFIPFLFLMATKAFSQLTPSTVAEIYNFSVGDTFEYSFEHWQEVCYENGFVQDVITNYSISGDSISIETISKVEFTSGPFSYWCNPNHPDSWKPIINFRIIHDKDSFIVNDKSRIDPCQPPLYLLQDSIYYSNIFNKRMCNGFDQLFDIKLAEGLGITDYNLYCESAKYRKKINLIYYHRTNGEQWGVYHPLTTGVENLRSDIQNITTRPNPASNSITISINTTETKELHYNIINIVGKSIQEGTIIEKETTLDIHNLSSGMYVVNVLGSKGERWIGKVVKE